MRKSAMALAASPITERLHLFLDCLSTPIGQMILVADNSGNLRVAFFAEDEEPVRRQLNQQYGSNGFLLESAHNPHGLKTPTLFQRH